MTRVRLRALLALTPAEWAVLAYACLVLPCAAVAVRTAPLPAAVRLIGGITRRRHPTRSRIEPARLAELVRAAGTGLGFRCLPQALTLHRLLVQRGLDSDVLVGAAPGSRFHAHAWVEHEGTALLGTGNLRAIWRAHSRPPTGAAR